MKTTNMNHLCKIIAEQQAYITELNDALYAAKIALNRLSASKSCRFKETEAVKMYRCQNCSLKFLTPCVILESHGFTTPPYQRLSACPRCKDADIYFVKE